MKTLAAQLTSYAKSDLAAARKRGHMIVGGTKEGAVAVTHEAGTYTLTKQGLDARVLATGKPRVVAPVLAALYVVTEA